MRRLRPGRAHERDLRGNDSPNCPPIETLRDIAKARGATVAQVALAWVISFHGRAVVAIPGATKPAQASDSAAAMGIGLSEASSAHRRGIPASGARADGVTFLGRRPVPEAKNWKTPGS